MLRRLDADPDQAALELLIDFQGRYPDRYNARHLRMLQRRLKIWRREAVQRLICEMQGFTTNVGSGPIVSFLLPPAASDRTALRW
jgi:hypothetical protein